MAYVAIADRDAPIHDPHTFIEKYIWSQDHKVIAIQYAIVAIFVGLVALVLSGLMRLQLGFPDQFHFVDPSQYYQFITMHGMIMVIYLLTALFLGGFGNYLIPLLCGARDLVFPYMNMLSFWVYLLAVIVLLASFLVPCGPTGAGWPLYPPQAVLTGTPGAGLGIILMLASLAIFIVAFTMGGLNYVTTVLQARCRGMTLMRMPLSVWGIFMATILGLLAFGFTRDARYITSPLVDKPAPAFTVALFDGQEMSLEDVRGKAVFLNFWASWCPPCRAEARDLEAAWQRVKDKNVVFIGVALQDTDENSREFLKEFNVTYPNGKDLSGRMAIDYGTWGIPESFFIDPEGRITYKHVGGIGAELVLSKIEEAAKGIVSAQEGKGDYSPIK